MLTLNYIKKEILLKSLLSFIGFTHIYHLTYLIGYIIALDWQYSNKNAWTLILLLSVVPFVNKMGLWLLFTPIEMIIESRIVAARNLRGWGERKNPILCGNYGPVDEEQSY